MLEAYHKHHSKPKTTVELKEMLQSTWNSLPQADKAVKECQKQLKACVTAGVNILNILNDCGIVSMNL